MCKKLRVWFNEDKEYREKRGFEILNLGNKTTSGIVIPAIDSPDSFCFGIRTDEGRLLMILEHEISKSEWVEM